MDFWEQQCCISVTVAWRRKDLQYLFFILHPFMTENVYGICFSPLRDWHMTRVFFFWYWNCAPQGITRSLQSLFMDLVRRPVWNHGSFSLPRSAQDNDGFTGPWVLAQNPLTKRTNSLWIKECMRLMPSFLLLLKNANSHFNTHLSHPHALIYT